MDCNATPNMQWLTHAMCKAKNQLSDLNLHQLSVYSLTELNITKYSNTLPKSVFQYFDQILSTHVIFLFLIKFCHHLFAEIKTVIIFWHLKE